MAEGTRNGPLVLAHRGLHDVAPENTWASFQAADDAGCDGVETDVRLSGDDELVLYHDRALPGGALVARTPAARISRIVGYEVPVLADALRAFPHLFWNLDLKAPPAAEPALEVLERAGLSGSALVTSYRHDLIATIASGPGPALGLITASRLRDPRAFLLDWEPFPRVRIFVLPYEIVDEPTLVECRRAAFDVFVFGLDTASDHRLAAEGGVAGLITDHPRQAGGRERPRR